MTDDTTNIKPIRVLVWDEAPTHAPKSLYPDSINGAVAAGLNAMGNGNIIATTANLDDPDQGCRDDVLHQTDVLFWWGHARHREVSDDTMMRVFWHVHERGMGFVALHSAHYSKTLQAVLGCPGHLKGGWREETPADVEEITVCASRHPIAKGVSDFTLSEEEMYGAPFDVPPPQCLVLQSYFAAGGEYFPCGICWTVGRGKTEGFTSGRAKESARGKARAACSTSAPATKPTRRIITGMYKRCCTMPPCGAPIVSKKKQGERQKRQCRYFLLTPFSFCLAYSNIAAISASHVK